MPHSENRAIQKEFSVVSRGYTVGNARRDSREDREILKWLELRPSDRVLDAACGAGILGRVIAPRVRSVFGLDLCWQMIERGRALRGRTASGPVFTVGTVTQLPYRARSFDLVICSYAFANFSSPLDVLCEFARVIKTRGRIAITEILAPKSRAQRVYLNRIEGFRGGLPARILGMDDFLALFREARLKVVSVACHRRRRTGLEWLRQSPAAANRDQARRLWQLLAESICGDSAGLHPRRENGDIIFYHATASFLLRLQRPYRRSARGKAEAPLGRACPRYEGA
ncbi:MAG TPA: methyltransferase domain-containing protein [Terriglobia bacterium]|nr:methyltransferase domain-containing protein [Terriglobia bacterium]